MKAIQTMILCLLLLTACAPIAVQPTKPAAVANPPTLTPYVAPVKEVEMSTQTPMAPTTTPFMLSASGSPTADPNLPAPTSTSVGLPKTFAELGIPATTYEDLVSRLAFDYPSSLFFTPISDNDKANAVIYSVSLRSEDPNGPPKKEEGFSPDTVAIDVTVIKNGPKTYEQAVNERRASAGNSESGQPVRIVAEEEWTLRDGTQAHRFLYNLGKDLAAAPDSPDRMSSELVTMINGRMVLVSGWGDLSMFNLVAASLRGIKQ